VVITHHYVTLICGKFCANPADIHLLGIYSMFEESGPLDLDHLHVCRPPWLYPLRGHNRLTQNLLSKHFIGATGCSFHPSISFATKDAGASIVACNWYIQERQTWKFDLDLWTPSSFYTVSFSWSQAIIDSPKPFVLYEMDYISWHEPMPVSRRRTTVFLGLMTWVFVKCANPQ
jgi:hypothetical protein